MPVEVEFALHVPRPDWVTFRDLHAVVSAWLDLGRGARSDRAADHSKEKPYTLKSATAADAVRVRLALLDDRVPRHDAVTVADDLIQGLDVHRRPNATGLTLGGQPFASLALDVGEDGQTEYLRTVSFDLWDALRAARPSRVWRLRFDSTTTFRHDDAYIPFPVADRLVAGLCRVWEREAPMRLRTGCDSGACRHASLVKTVADSTRSSREQPFVLGPRGGKRVDPPRGFLGFRGETTIGMRAAANSADPALVRHTSTLLAFSRYAGVGYGTTRGHGATTPSPLLP